MDEEEMIRYGNKKFAIGVNVGRKQERERKEAERNKAIRKAYNAGRKKERRESWQDRRRKKWDWKYRVFSVRTVYAVAFTVVTLKAIEILMMQLAQ